MRFIDSHLHLGEYEDPESVVEAAVALDMVLVSSGIGKASSMRTLALAKEFPQTIRPFIGVHPAEAGKGEGLSWVSEYISSADGVGEIGLDPKYKNESPMEAQLSTFSDLLSAGEASRKPVQVHSRGAEKECLEVLSSFHLGSVQLHWFQGEELLRETEERGYFVSFGPALLSSGRLQRMVQSYPRGLVLVETDGPVPFAALGRASGPTLIPSVVFRISELWGTTFDECAQAVLANSLAYLGSGTKG
ncbi:MAG: TatD family hydrolase [Thaumarchaeota archaeon]|nr:TatD family hydrolase [Nitrososphaerota archaeon]